MNDVARRAIALCARQEAVLASRSRWTQLFAVVFGGLAVAVASAGYIFSGGSGIQDFARTAASLMQLVLLLVPLTSLVMGVLALTPDRGAAEILFSQPLPRSAVLLGTLLGLFEALVTAQLLGFGAAGLVIFLRAGEGGVLGFLMVAAGSVVLTAVFLSLAAAIASGRFGRRRIRALATALVLWVALALLFDVVVLAAASLLRSGHASRLLIVSTLANPIDAVRTASLLAIEGTAAFGSASAALFRFTNGPSGAAALLALSLAVWIAAPLAYAGRRLSRVDIA
jgi:Cu-processing system permease protein